jgi:phosphotransferase system HPr (HPr) family protein
MMRKEITVKTTSVYEPRSLAELVGVANDFSSRIMLIMENRQINAKSIMGIMGLGLDVDKVITIEAEGEDAAEAILAVDNFLTK